MGKVKKNTLIKQLDSLKKKLAKAKDRERIARSKWNNGYKKYNDAAFALATLKRKDTQKYARMVDIVMSWEDFSKELTYARDVARVEMEEIKKEMAIVEIKLAEHMKDIEAVMSENNEIVNQAFSLSRDVSDAFEKRNAYLNEHAYPRLVDSDGNLHSQITIGQSNGLRKVVMMTNTINIVEPDKASRAKDLIQNFFDNVTEVPQIEGIFKKIYDLTRNLLVEKIKFKVGPNLYMFLSLEIDPVNFPELYEAQLLLRGSIRSEKTSSYIRLYERKNRESRWEPVSLF